MGPLFSIVIVSNYVTLPEMVQTLKVTGENVTFLLALNDTRVNNLTGFG